MNPEQKVLLEQPLTALAINKELADLLLFHGYDTLEKVLAKGITFHRNKSGLTILDELELFRFCKDNGLEEFWKM